MNIKPKFILLCCWISFAVQSNEVIELRVGEDLVVFKTSKGKTQPSLNCVTQENKDYWGIPLNTEHGQASYAALVTAMSIKSTISVESKGICSNGTGIELAKQINLTPIRSSNYQNIQWVGYTTPVDGDFGRIGQTFHRSSYYTASRECKNQYPGSRVMRWEDYIVLGDAYPGELEPWIIEPASIIEQISSSNYFYQLEDGAFIQQSNQYGPAYLLMCNNFETTNAKG